MRARPKESEYGSYYGRYIALIPETEILPVLRKQLAEISELAAAVPAPREGYRYAEGKWSIREVVGHIIDVERVFAYRAFCIGRGDRASFPSFDENEYIAAGNYHSRTVPDLISELLLVRKSNLAFLEHLPEADWLRVGRASDNPFTANALSFIMAGHLRHHLNILQTKYGVESGN